MESNYPRQRPSCFPTVSGTALQTMPGSLIFPLFRSRLLLFVSFIVRRFCRGASAGYVCVTKALAGQVVELAVSAGVKGKTTVSHFCQNRTDNCQNRTDAQLSKQNRQTSEHDRQLSEQDRQLLEYDRQLSEKGGQLSEQDRQTSEQDS